MGPGPQGGLCRVELRKLKGVLFAVGGNEFVCEVYDPANIMISNREANTTARLILRRMLYCGMGKIISVALIIVLNLLPLYRFRIQIWGVDLEGIISRTLFSAGYCVSTVLALRRYRFIPLSIVVSLLIGLLTHKVAKEFLWALYPSDYEIGFGELGKFIDQHYSMVFGFNAGELVGDFLAALLIAFFCSALSRNMRALMGGTGAGLMIALIALLLSFWFSEVTMYASKVDLLVAMIMYIPQIFISGIILGGGIALGEYLAVRFPSQGQWRESSLETEK